MAVAGARSSLEAVSRPTPSARPAVGSDTCRPRVARGGVVSPLFRLRRARTAAPHTPICRAAAARAGRKREPWVPSRPCGLLLA